ncbi:MAG: N-diacetylbacillosaminyl-diphospho-undecaprenol alpha,3-N-acetylgalactosaminyltransferase [Bacteroidota bacterium]|jgi:glycosyltransferase involved in cell wall biosynthesis
MEDKKTLVRITTVPISLEKLLAGQLRYMSQFYRVVAVSSEKDNLERLGEKEKVATFHVHLTRKITPIADFKALIRLYFYFRKTKPAIVHTHTPKAGTIGMLAAKLAGVKIRLHTVAGLPLLEETGTKRKILNAVEKLTYACATKVYPNSVGLKDIIIQSRFCQPNKLKVIANGSSNGIDTEYFSRKHFSEDTLSQLQKQLGIQSEDFVFVFVGRLVKDKGINELIQAFCRLPQEQHPVKLLLVGDYESDLDPLQPNTLAQITSNPNIISTGFQTDVRPYFCLSHALVFPTYREGFPNVVLQAGALDLPGIVTNINGCNEIIVPGKNGLIIPVKEENAIFDAMQFFIHHPQETSAMKKNAREMIETRYKQAVVWEAIRQEYQILEQYV